MMVYWENPVLSIQCNARFAALNQERFHMRLLASLCLPKPKPNQIMEYQTPSIGIASAQNTNYQVFN